MALTGAISVEGADRVALTGTVSVEGVDRVVPTGTILVERRGKMRSAPQWRNQLLQNFWKITSYSRIFRG